MVRSIWDLIVEAYNEWSADNALRLGASLAYYTVFSIAPLLILVMAIVGFVYGGDAAKGQILGQVKDIAGPRIASTLQSMLNPQTRSSGLLATVVSIVTLLVGASGVFVELQDAMNIIWEAPRQVSAGLWTMVKDRLISFAIVFALGFVLLVSLVLSAVLSGVSGYLTAMLPGPLSGWMVEALHFIVSFGVITVLFALMFKFLPDVKTRWGDIWVGAVITALLFTIGKFALGLYLGRNGTTSIYGAAASFILLLMWVYYSAEILFYGAEMTKVYAKRRGWRAVPDKPVAAERAA